MKFNLNNFKEKYFYTEKKDFINIKNSVFNVDVYVPANNFNHEHYCE